MSGTKARKETKEFYHASNDTERPVQPEDRLHTAEDEHHVSRGSKGGQEMTR